MLFATAAHAQSPDAFRSAAPLEVEAGQPLHRVTLPFEAYRDGRADLADVRVFDANGEAMPLAFIPPQPPTWHGEPAIDLPRFPVTTRDAADTGGDQVTIRTRDGTLVELKGARRARTLRARPVAVLLDATAVKGPIGALVFDWSAQPGTQVVQVRAEASDDLRTWEPVASGPLVKIVHGSRLLEQPRLSFTPRTAKYYRITWDAPQFELDGVRAEPPPRTLPVPRRSITVVPQVTPREGEHEYDLGAALPVEAVQLRLADVNSMVGATFLARNDANQSWVPVGSSGFYRLARDGGELASFEAIPVGNCRDAWERRQAPERVRAGSRLICSAY